MTKLTNKALEAINQPHIRRRLMGVFLCTEQTVRAYIKDNSVNLTQVDALEVIRQETGLTDSEILEKDEELVKA